MSRFLHRMPDLIFRFRALLLSLQRFVDGLKRSPCNAGRHEGAAEDLVDSGIMFTLSKPLLHW